MITQEEATLTPNEAEPPAAEQVPVVPVNARSHQAQPQPWGYFLAGMVVALLAVALGAVLGYLARPALDPATGSTANISLPVEGSVGIQAPPAQPDNAGQPETQANVPASEDKPGASPPTPTIMDFVLSDARHFQGNDDAPVTLVEFSDFKCPYCGRFSAETLPRLREKYINTGQVRFVYKHFAILGPESSRTAEATECAAEQGKFWEYHDRIFADQTTVRSILDDDKLGELASEIGLDTSAFSECLASGRYAGQIQRESQAAGAMGLRGTPGFLINGVFVSGAQPFEVFQQVIEEQLQASNQNE
jgi:protein-disulfide isomerase